MTFIITISVLENVHNHNHVRQRQMSSFDYFRAHLSAMPVRSTDTDALSDGSATGGARAITRRPVTSPRWRTGAWSQRI
jgi:hypothetical protein